MGMNVQLDNGAATVAMTRDAGSEAVVAEINITPLTDVFLVLLIIFMVTSTALVESEVASRAGMKVVLPKANAAGPVSQRRTDPVLTVTKANELYLGAHKVDPGEPRGGDPKGAAPRWARRRCSSAATRTSFWAPRSTSCPPPRRPGPPHRDPDCAHQVAESRQTARNRQFVARGVRRSAPLCMTETEPCWRNDRPTNWTRAWGGPEFLNAWNCFDFVERRRGMYGASVWRRGVVTELPHQPQIRSLP